MKLRNISFVLAFVLILADYVFGGTQQVLLNQTLFLMFPLFTALAGAIAFSMFGLKSITGKSMLAMTLGFSCWAIGEIIWYVSKNFLGIEPFPSVADVFFLLGYPLVFLGLYFEFGKAQIKFSQIKRSLLVTSALVALILAGIVSYFGIYLAYDANVSSLENAVAMSYGIVDLILIVSSLFALAIARAYRGGKFVSFWTATISGFLFFLVADILFAIYNAPYAENLSPYIYIDLLWIAGYLLLAYGMLDNYFYIQSVKQGIKNRQK